ncbi:NAD(P)/FAD-dependent oxidoreductase [Geobacter sp. DSM 9736]|uniref:NAD(P)/FAD-dependent oxidoreductase n=1 Tax=Geobacter sp. DSM 9736 TaxID=1277350 RepID=UPI000B5033BB|nr:FAD-dependent oxidoreductase [Geobacter sp. DSM 9736]SNB47773.1 NADPH-dependent 2,4-dienoyl-CoA reductase, sulfur reductase [Geobacter sp. DSM 9736]
MRYDYVIVGGGMAADAAVKGIREIDGSGTIALISEESAPPYARPPLSKKLWQGKPVESIWRGTEAAGAELFLGHRVEHLDPREKAVRDSSGSIFEYGKLLLATGGSPRRFLFSNNEVIYFRTLGDYTLLRELTEKGQRFAVIGGGFIGSEIAAALAMVGKEVTLLFPEASICKKVFPADLSLFLNEHYRRQGVEVLAGDTVAGVARHGELLTVKTGSSRLLSVDGVVAGLGIDLNLELAVRAGCTTGNGIEVDEQLRALPPDIFAAGDVASYHVPALEGRYRFEHEDNALAMGRQAGRNMAGAGEAYRHLPFFYSDMFDLGYEAVGELDAGLDVVADWQEPYRKGVLYYMRQDKVRGVLLWNVWDQVDHARRLIESGVQVKADELKGRLPA